MSRFIYSTGEISKVNLLWTRRVILTPQLSLRRVWFRPGSGGMWVVNWGVNSRGDGWSILDQLISRHSAARWRSVILGGGETCKLWPCEFYFCFCDCDQWRLVLRIWCYPDTALHGSVWYSNLWHSCALNFKIITKHKCMGFTDMHNFFCYFSVKGVMKLKSSFLSRASM